MRNDVTRANAVSERKKSFRKFDFFSFALSTNVKRKRVRRRNKKHSRKNSGSDSKRQSFTKEPLLQLIQQPFVFNHQLFTSAGLIFFKMLKFIPQLHEQEMQQNFVIIKHLVTLKKVQYS